jgi:dihydropteroate synthase
VTDLGDTALNLRPKLGRSLGRPRIMGILNVTPDSFSDGGLYDTTAAALEHSVSMHAQGADVIDVGGESTRPGAERVSADEEQHRVLPVIRGLVERGIPVSIDTMRASTALAAAEAGVAMINDVYRVVAQTRLHYIVMHWRGHLGDGADATGLDAQDYESVVTDVRNELKQRIAELLVWGVKPNRIILDPGLGFSKTAQNNWELLRGLPELTTLGYPVLIGASRKRFLAPLLAEDAAPADRDPATAVISALAAQAGAWGVRVHDVASTKAALDVWTAWTEGAKL